MFPLSGRPNIVKLTAHRDVPKLMRALAWGSKSNARGESTGTVRAEAARALGAIADRRAIEPLVTALTDAQAQVRYTAAEALGRIGDAAAVGPLCRSLSDAEAGYAVAEALGRIGDRQAVEPLCVALTNGTGSRVACTEALGAIGDVRAVNQLFDILANSEFSATVYGSALAALQAIGEPAVDVLLAVAVDPCGIPRWNAAHRALRAIGKCEALFAALTAADSDERKRTLAADVLAEIGTGRAARLLCKAAASRNGTGNEAAVKAIHKIRDSQAVDTLCAAITHHDTNMRQVIAEALGSIGDYSSVHALCGALSDPDPTVRETAARALGATRKSEAAEPLCAALADPNVGVRRTVVAALARIGSERRYRAGGYRYDDPTVEPLCAALTDPDSGVHRAAAKALVAIGDERAARLVDPRDPRAVGSLCEEYANALGERTSVSALAHLLDRAGRVIDMHLLEKISELPELTQTVLVYANTECEISSGTKEIEIDCAQLRQLARQEMIRRESVSRL